LSTEIRKLSPAEILSLVNELLRPHPDARGNIAIQAADENRAEFGSLISKVVAHQLPNSIKREIIDLVIASPDDTQVDEVLADEILGFREKEIEALRTGKLNQWQFKGEEPWLGLPSPQILTPYFAFSTLLKELNPPSGATFAELGAGPGRGAVVIGRKRPDLKYIGYELLLERVEEGQAAIRFLQIRNARMLKQNLSDPHFLPEHADYFYIFNSFSEETFDKVYRDLGQLAKTKAIHVLVTDNSPPPPREFDGGVVANLVRSIRLPGMWGALDVWVFSPKQR
jgi:hypothetical protein